MRRNARSGVGRTGFGRAGFGFTIAAAFFVGSFAAPSHAVEINGPVFTQAASAGLVTEAGGGVVGNVSDLLGLQSDPPTTRQVESAFLGVTNAERTKRGLRPLLLASDLTAAARRQSSRMASYGDIWHNLHLEDEIADWHDLGENVGRGPTVGDIQIAFMESPSHRDNILDAIYTDVGIGATRSDSGLIFITLDFAARMPRQTAARVAVARVLPREVEQPRSVSMLLALLAFEA